VVGELQQFRSGTLIRGPFTYVYAFVRQMLQALFVHHCDHLELTSEVTAAQHLMILKVPPLANRIEPFFGTRFAVCWEM
jgi:hypothetical protein